MRIRVCYDGPAFLSRSTSLYKDAAGPAPPDAFGPFRVLHQIGAGALGPLYRGYDPDRDRLVAVKWFRLDLPPERVHRLVAGLEHLIGSGLAHPAITSSLATGIVGVASYLAQDFVAAESLDVVVRQHGPAPAAEAVRVATHLGNALDCAAAAGVVHGGLHPRDVLVSPDTVKLTGLGIVRALERAGAAAPVRRPYAAPERAANAVWDGRADTFSLAAVIHELLWGKRVAATGQQAADALGPLPGADVEALRAVFARALAENPDDRFATALDFAVALKKALHVEDAPSSKVLSPSGLTLGGPDAPRYQDVEPAPVVEPASAVVRDPVLASPIQPAARARHGVAAPGAFVAATIERTGTAVWPLMLAIVVGISIGFALGYGVGTRQRGLPSESAADLASSAAATSGTSAREFTETAVREPEGRAAIAAPGNPEDSGVTGRSERAAAAPEAPGRLLIRSTPAGARVFVDGRDVGLTPQTVRGVTGGAHTVRVARDGYVAQQRRVVISADRPAQSLAIDLARARPASRAPSTPATRGRPPAAMRVESRPAGANVFLDDKLVGRTPLQLDDVDAGEHAVRLELDGYRGWTSSVRVVAGERSRVAASLER